MDLIGFLIFLTNINIFIVIWSIFDMRCEINNNKNNLERMKVRLEYNNQGLDKINRTLIDIKHKKEL